MADTNDLIPGWESRVDRKKNADNYYHHNTKKTQDMKPLLPGDTNYDRGDDGLIPGWIKRLDPYSNTHYYFHYGANKAQVKQPTLPRNKHHDKGKDGLIPGWIRRLDPYSDTYYFWNTGSKKAQAEEPTLPLDKHYDRDDIGLTPGWIRRLDPHSETYYYYHHLTKMTQLKEPTMSLHHRYNRGSGGLIPGWIRRSDPHSHTHYYFHPETHVSGTKMPTIPSDEQYYLDTSGLPRGWIRVLDPYSGTLYFYISERQRAQKLKPMDSKTDSLDKDYLSPEWTLGYDEARDQCYYVNDGTGRTVWFEPVTQSRRENIFVAHQRCERQEQEHAAKIDLIPPSTDPARESRNPSIESLCSASTQSSYNSATLDNDGDNDEVNDGSTSDASGNTRGHEVELPRIGGTGALSEPHTKNVGTGMRAKEDHGNQREDGDPIMETAPSMIASSIAEIQKEMEYLDILKCQVDAFSGSVHDKKYLFLKEQFTKLMIRIDKVDAHGNDSVRIERIDSLKRIYRLMDELEAKIGTQ